MRREQGIGDSWTPALRMASRMRKIKGTPSLTDTTVGKTGGVPDTITVAELLGGGKEAWSEIITGREENENL